MIFSKNHNFWCYLIPKIDSVAHFLSKNVYFNICHGKNSKVTAVDKFQKFRVNTPLKRCLVSKVLVVSLFQTLILYSRNHYSPGGVLSGKVGTGMCGPDGVLFPPLRFTNGPLFIWNFGLDIGRVFAKWIIFDKFFLWFTYRLSKSTYASQFTW